MSRGMVVAPQSEVVEICARILAEGGNAFDAVTAGAFAQGVVDPHRCGIGGFGAATLYSSEEQKVDTVSFFARCGSKARAGLWEDKLQGPAPDGFGYIVSGKENDVGYLSIATPGTVAGLSTIHKRYGSLKWKELLGPASQLARRGFLVGPGLASFWRRPGLFGRVSTRERLGFTEEGRRLWLSRGVPPQAGDIVTLEPLAETYDRLAASGPEDFYTGELARRILSDFQLNGALVTGEDLSSYNPRWQKPLEGEFLGSRIATTALPGGGVALLQALYASSEKGLSGKGLHSPGYVDLLARIFSAVQNDRTAYQADPEFEPVSADRFLSPEYLNEVLQRPLIEGSAGAESPDTTELVVVDRWGNAAVLCHSLGYGSGVFTPGLGFMYNNCMSGFDPVPGRPNSIAPGKARTTAMAQTAVVSGERLILLGSPGGAHITAALTQVLLNLLHFGLDLQDAVCRPRFDAYKNTLLLESRMPFTIEDYLGGKWRIKRNPRPFGVVGRVYGIEAGGGKLRPGYDPGEPGCAREL